MKRRGRAIYLYVAWKIEARRYTDGMGPDWQWWNLP